MNIEYAKVDTLARIINLRAKLKNELIGLRCQIDIELDKINNEVTDYIPTNELGLVTLSGSIIDNYIGKISELRKIQELLDILKE